jgi:3-(3-hydroxy-phenyl)propionate hydroxylase
MTDHALVIVGGGRASQDLVGSRAGGLHSRFVSTTALDISHFPTRHNYGLALWQTQIERVLADWVQT